MGAIAFVLLTISFFTAHAQVSNYITVTTDKTTYSDGDAMTISGNVMEQLNIPISIVIRDPSQTIVYIGQVNPNSDNTFSTQAIAGGSLWKSSGTYEVDVTYASKDKTAKTTFEFTGTKSSSNQTSTSQHPNQVIPEFGSSSTIVIIIATIIVIISTRFRLRSLQ